MRTGQETPPPTDGHDDDPGPRGALAELRAFLAENKAWWIVPIAILVIVAVGIVVVATTNVGPYIYTFF